MTDPQAHIHVNPGFTASRKKRVVRYRETIDFLAFIRRIVRASGKRIEEGDLSELRALVAIKEDLDTAIVRAVDGLRRTGVTWAEIGDELGMTRQGAFQYFGPRLGSTEQQHHSLEDHR